MTAALTPVERPAGAVPREPMLPHFATLDAVVPEAYGISTFTFHFDEKDHAARYRFRSGQFNMLYLPGFGESAISMSSSPHEPESIGHTIRFAGNVTRGLARLRPGDRIGIRGPFGVPWPVDQARGKDLLIAAGGIGLAPLRPVIYEVLRNRSDFGRVVLLYGARTPADLLYTAQLEGWRAAGLEVLVTVDRAEPDWHGHVGVGALLFYRMRINPKETVVFTCGPEVMMRFTIYEALARRVPPESIWVSLERNMKCAVGFCGHCQLGPLFVCRDGPVFNFAAIEDLFNREEF